MKTIRLKTNLHCGSCVSKLGPLLDGDKRIHHWNIDLEDPQRPLSVHGDVGEDEVKRLVQAAGFTASGETAESYAACDMHDAEHAQQTAGVKESFWADRVKWKRAALNTFSCLVGCAIGDFAMLIFLQAYYPQTPMGVQMILAIAAGLLTSIALETALMRYREKMIWKLALRTALSMSFLSMIAMEVAMNLADFMIMGGKAAFSDPRYWLAFIPAALAGFLVSLPYNYYQLKKHNISCH